MKNRIPTRKKVSYLNLEKIDILNETIYNTGLKGKINKTKISK